MRLTLLPLIAILPLLGLSAGSRARKKAQLVQKYLLRKRAFKEGDLRLIGGSTHSQGNVEIYHLGRWGSVCDDEWDSREAEVVCRQLGFPSAIKPTHSSAFGPTSKKYWMDNVYCTGNEVKLSQCRFDGWAQNDCTKEEAAGVVCKSKQVNKTSSNQIKSLPVKEKLPLKTIFAGKLNVRLSGGRNSQEGRVEVKLEDGDWGSICGDEWSLLEASVVCRHLKLGHALVALQRNHFSGNESEILLSGLECRGNESSISECKMNNPRHETNCPGPKDALAGVVCTQQLADLLIDYEEIMRSSYLEDRQLYFLQCAMEENCLGSSAYQIQKENPSGWHLETRRLLRFTARILNIGTEPFRPALPKHMWQFHMCHMHYHSMEVFATFDVMEGGKKVAEGHKASFCLEDNQCLPGVKPGFACANYGDQGISVNCSDIYKHNIDCQWVDISDLQTGLYTFKVAINPEFKIPEISFENNAAVCQMHYTESYVKIHSCYLTRP